MLVNPLHWEMNHSRGRRSSHLPSYIDPIEARFGLFDGPDDAGSSDDADDLGGYDDIGNDVGTGAQGFGSTDDFGIGDLGEFGGLGPDFGAPGDDDLGFEQDPAGYSISPEEDPYGTDMVATGPFSDLLGEHANWGTWAENVAGPTLGQALMGQVFGAMFGPLGMLAARGLGKGQAHDPDTQAAIDQEMADINTMSPGDPFGVGLHEAGTHLPGTPVADTPLQEDLKEKYRTTRYRGGRSHLYGNLYDVNSGAGLSPMQAEMMGRTYR